MKNHPIYENLDTSFVNLSALLRYLRRRQFLGSVHVELSGYEAEIFILEDNKLRAREHDRLAGRIAEGEEALQRILIRSREPGGIVNVYQTAPAEEKAIAKNTEKAAEKVSNAPQNIKTNTVSTPAAPVLANAATNGKQQTAAPKKEAVIEKPKIEEIVVEKPKPKITLPNLPFEFTNKVEAKAKPTTLSPADWQLLLNLTGELLAAIDKSLAEANLDFSAAFLKARTEISADYPFMNPSEKVFDYKDGRILMRGQPNAKLFSASILEALRRLLEKLGANPKFSAVYRQTTQNILTLIHHRRPFYDKFSMTKTLEKMLGI